MHIGNPNALGTTALKDFIKRRGEEVTLKLADEVWGKRGMWSPDNKFTDWPEEKKLALIGAMKHYDEIIDPVPDDKKTATPKTAGSKRVLVSFNGPAASGKTRLREFLMTVLETTGFETTDSLTLSEDDFYVKVDSEALNRLVALNTRGDGVSVAELPKDGSPIARQQRAVEECRAAHAAFRAAIEKAEDIGVQICSTSVNTDFDGKPTLVVNDYKTEPDYLVKL